MRRSTFMLATLPAAAALSCHLAPVSIAPDPFPAPQDATIRVIPRPSVTYRTTAQMTVGVLRLLRCDSLLSEAAGEDTVHDSSRRHVVRNGAGDSLAVPASRAPKGTRLRLVRQGRTPHRILSATASGFVTGATLTIDLRGCDPSPDTTVVRRGPMGVWEDVGGTVSGTSITTPPLDHLSIYALAGG